jgi:hypothetical protein
MSLEAENLLAGLRRLVRSVALSAATPDEKQYMLGQVGDLTRAVGAWSEHLRADMRRPLLPRTPSQRRDVIESAR